MLRRHVHLGRQVLQRQTTLIELAAQEGGDQGFHGCTFLAARNANSSTSTMWWRSTCGCWTTPKCAASTTAAPAAPELQRCDPGGHSPSPTRTDRIYPLPRSPQGPLPELNPGRHGLAAPGWLRRPLPERRARRAALHGLAGSQ